MAVSMADLADDLAAESAVLRDVLAPLHGPDWGRETPAEGWTIADQVTHLAYFDDVAVESAIRPDEFRAERDRIEAEGGVDPDAVANRFRHLPGTAVLSWFDQARDRLLASFRPLDPSLRVPWFGPAMSAASSLTARIMETWAHGQDIADTLGVVREPTGRLRHVAHIGVGARDFSYATNGLTAPRAPVRVELTAPGGETWAWGPEGAADRITGPALEFCLLVTQRRHRDDLDLEIAGPAAVEWMRIAQAFAGPPGTGRARRPSAKEEA
ncbi:MAG TPA: TIGR03084 family metal-binding protein [Acidimicrobiales bacterium]|jgi:uncharacterized protein (TIGR03084 family)|nr:TIGR03084 family metal-binding protein [Acidimicrobiales bacterium]